ncbi:hypothetical protein TNCV_4898961 [Trichonephila clavipes]|nr:hypothetical protein TNCV_4898961 [Trichonephila clavipes]
MTPELTPPLLTTTPHQREDVSALDRFNVHRCPTRRVFRIRGRRVMSSSRVPLKARRVDALMYVKPVKAQSPSVGVMRKFRVKDLS